MAIPIASIAETNVNSGIILDNNADNIIDINIKAKQLINQTAFLEVSHVSQLPDTQSGGNYDNDSLRINVHTSSPITNTISRSLPYYSEVNNNYTIYPIDDPEGKWFVMFLFIAVIIIVILVKIN